MSSTPRRRRQTAADLLSPDLVAVGGDESVNVAVRVRPFNRRELDIHRQRDPSNLIRSVVEMPDGTTGTVRMLERDPQTGEFAAGEEFQYTKSFWSIPEEQQPSRFPAVLQEDVFKGIGRVILTNAISGFNSSVFAYGQTGSGKTHTMMGDFTIKDNELSGDPGIIPRLCRDLFSSLASKKAELEADDGRLSVAYDVKLSALEIYNEQVRDLFWKGSSIPGRTKNSILKIRVHPTEGAFVDQLTTLNPGSWEACLKLIASGVSERTVAATLMNDESSRSHSVFQICITQTETLGPDPNDPGSRFEKPVVTTRSSRINLVDLAGSERNKKSGVSGQQLREAAGINQSLTTLKKVIDALVQNGTEKNPKRHVIVPYRESALTQLLSHSLGGNSKTTMIACVSPHYDNQEETVNTLRYANRAKGIVNHVKANQDDAQRRAMLLRQQLDELQNKLQEGPQVLSPQELDELRDQILVGEKEMAERQQTQRQAEREAAHVAAQLKSQKDARYAATFYNSFKRCWLQRQHSVCEGLLHQTEIELQTAEQRKDELSLMLAERDRASADARFTHEELQRRSALWVLKSARNEASARELARDINKRRSRAEESLAARYGSVWVRNRAEAKLQMSAIDEKEALNKDHDQYLQSITQEARKQFSTLLNTYADREQAQQDRLEQVERGVAYSTTTVEKLTETVSSRKATLERCVKEYQRREEDKSTAWGRRLQQTQRLYEEKLEALAKAQSEAKRVRCARNVALRKDTLVDWSQKEEALRSRKVQVTQDCEQRLAETVSEAQLRASETVSRCRASAALSRQEILGQFSSDVMQVQRQSKRKIDQVLELREQLKRLRQFALDIESVSRRVNAALLATSSSGPGDFRLGRQRLSEYQQLARESNFEFHRVASVLERHIPQAGL